MPHSTSRRNLLARTIAGCLIFLLATLTLAPTLSAAVVAIDDFTSGPLNELLNSGNTGGQYPQTGLDPGHVIGGHRTPMLLLNFPSVPGDEATLEIDTSAGTFTVDSNAELEAYRLEWGLRALALGPAANALNADLSSANLIRINVLSASHTHQVFIELRSGVDEAAIGSLGFWAWIPATATPLVVDVPIPGAINYQRSDTDYIALGEGPLPAGFHLTLGAIHAVPEPGAMGLVVSGGLAWACAAAIRKRLKVKRRSA